jgi:hypothetical protein
MQFENVQGLAHRTNNTERASKSEEGSPFIKSRETKTAVIIIKIMIKIYSIKITSNKALERIQRRRSNYVGESEDDDDNN